MNPKRLFQVLRSEIEVKGNGSGTKVLSKEPVLQPLKKISDVLRHHTFKGIYSNDEIQKELSKLSKMPQFFEWKNELLSANNLTEEQKKDLTKILTQVFETDVKINEKGIVQAEREDGTYINLNKDLIQNMAVALYILHPSYRPTRGK